ncbi:MAG TPA: PEGA domain-containing protein [Candidatus Binataceae bacterium]|jgi:hypothetical protein|nr:PEGA domain-containing protein [Candidatus Binataceae bacterium]
MKKLGILMIVMLAGCATTLRGTSEQLQIYSTPGGATASLSDGQSCTTPCDIKISRGKAYNVTFNKDGCESATQLISPKIAGSGVAESLVVGGIIDFADGAVYDSEPNPVSATLNCKLAAADVKPVSATAAASTTRSSAAASDAK